MATPEPYAAQTTSPSGPEKCNLRNVSHPALLSRLFNVVKLKSKEITIVLELVFVLT